MLTTPLLRTVRASFPAHGSSLAKAYQNKRAMQPIVDLELSWGILDATEPNYRANHPDQIGEVFLPIRVALLAKFQMNGITKFCKKRAAGARTRGSKTFEDS